MANPAGTVAAVMTYNRQERLRRCLEGIRAQTLGPAAVIVVDNASTDGTGEMLRREFPDVHVHRTDQNLGCAGAMHEALRAALAMNPEYIWFFDDDVVPDPHCLETLLTEMRVLQRDRRIGVLRPMIRDPQSGDIAGGGISHGALLRAEMVADVGFPLAALFIELSDQTYNLRIRQHGYEILRVPVVLAQHPVDRPRSLGEIIRGGYRVTPWRLYYAVRNRIYFSLYLQPSAGRFVRNLALAARTVLLVTLFGRPRRGQILVLRGIVDGVFGKLGRRVQPGY
jgi:rhamnopyranosyl-N-acetylglucosaminyl-diphospho-decaprenol beta-1,3/1,4-galactofuranosyltransferase